VRLRSVGARFTITEGPGHLAGKHDMATNFMDRNVRRAPASSTVAFRRQLLTDETECWG